MSTFLFTREKNAGYELLGHPILSRSNSPHPKYLYNFCLTFVSQKPMASKSSSSTGTDDASVEGRRTRVYWSLEQCSELLRIAAEKFTDILGSSKHGDKLGKFDMLVECLKQSTAWDAESSFPNSRAVYYKLHTLVKEICSGVFTPGTGRGDCRRIEMQKYAKILTEALERHQEVEELRKKADKWKSCIDTLLSAWTKASSRGDYVGERSLAARQVLSGMLLNKTGDFDDEGKPRIPPIVEWNFTTNAPQYSDGELADMQETPPSPSGSDTIANVRLGVLDATTKTPRFRTKKKSVISLHQPNEALLCSAPTARPHSSYLLCDILITL